MVNNYTHSNRREKWGIGVLGELLQELRKDKGMTQAELAAKLELSPLTVSSYECGRSAPDDETKVKIAEIFDVSVDYLLGRDTTEPENQTVDLAELANKPKDFDWGSVLSVGGKPIPEEDKEIIRRLFAHKLSD